ncbi:hypothetical protein Rs2_02411 [Raphanus sativus]|nr:hypothetical protein Rs2_02411 [Raphanus sativus]
MEDVHDEATREILANDQVEGKMMFEKIHQWSQMIKISQIGKEDIASVVVPVVEVAVENSEVEISPDLTASSDPSLVEPSPPSDPSAAKGQVLSPLEQKSDSRVVNNVSVSPVLKTDKGKEDVVSAAVPVDEVAVENCEVETSPAVSKSLPPNPSAAKGQGLSLLEQKSDSPVVNNVSVPPVPKTDFVFQKSL